MGIDDERGSFSVCDPQLLNESASVFVESATKQVAGLKPRLLVQCLRIVQFKAYPPDRVLGSLA